MNLSDKSAGVPLTLEQKLFLKACLLGIALSIVGLSVNLFVSGNIMMVVLNVICASLLYFLYLSAKNKTTFNIAVVLLIILSLSGVSSSWFLINGITGPAAFNFIIVIVVLTSLINYRHYSFFILVVLINITILIYLQYSYPEWVTEYSNKEQKVFDISISLYCTLLLTSLPVFYFKKAYQTNQKLVETKNERLLETQEDLKKEKEKAEESNRVKSNFLSVMSHEIRTPLNAIISVSHILKEHNFDNSEDVELVNALNSSSEHLLSLLNDILDFSKIESGNKKIKSIETNIKNLISNIQGTYLEKSKEKNNLLIIDINENVPENIITDDGMLRQVLGNLISNAIKFTSNGTVKVTVDQKSIKNKLTTLLFKITDTGIGIPENKIKSIFDKFTQIDSINQKKEMGTGLGLSICKQLLLLMNSDIQVQSTEGEGSVFSFVLNCPVVNKIQEEQEKSGVVETVPFKESSNLLVVEDNKVNVLVLSRFLKKWHINFEVAFNGVEALEKYKPNKFNAILMDMQMPVMNGFDATKKLREEGCKIPIIALSASATSVDIANAKEAGVDDYLLKPFDPLILYKIIKKSIFFIFIIFV
jgi:signal transduction histidine kinase